MDQRFPKYERLTHKRLIEQLLREGNSFAQYPVRTVFLPCALPTKARVQVLFAVSKKRVPHAVDRNRIKRLMREAYRLHKSELFEFLGERNTQLAVAFIYQAPEPLVYSEVQDKIILSLIRLKKELETTDSSQ